MAFLMTVVLPMIDPNDVPRDPRRDLRRNGIRAGLSCAVLAAACLAWFYAYTSGEALLGWMAIAIGLAAAAGLAVSARGAVIGVRTMAASLRTLQDRLASITRASGGWAWETDRDGRITYCGEGAKEVLGVVPEAILGKTFGELGFSPVPAATAGPSQASQSELVRLRANEAPQRFACAIVEVQDANGRACGLRGICLDITDAEREAGKLRALEENVSQADKAGMLDYVISGIAHELNQPLAAVSAYCNASLRLLRQSPESIDEVLTALAAASNQAQSAAQVVKRMRGFMMRREPKVTVSSVDALVDDAFALAAIRLQQDGARVECSIESGLPGVRVDTILIVQVILNLLYNALDAMSERADKRVCIRAIDDGDGWVTVSVIDNGAGIDDEKLSQVFNPYFTTKSDGLGLGLPICVSILEAHGSTLVLERNDAGGCTARFRLEQEGVL